MHTNTHTYCMHVRVKLGLEPDGETHHRGSWKRGVRTDDLIEKI